MEWYDVTRPLGKEILVFPGDVVPAIHQEVHGEYLISELKVSSHTGTHIDAPSHYLKKGNTIDRIPLSNLIGPCRVVDVRDAGIKITKSHLVGRIEDAERLLLKTAFSGIHYFKEDYPSLSVDAAGYITSCNIRCVGTDAPSIESFVCDGSIHRHLLNGGCIIIELLDLSSVAGGEYEMIALPLRLQGLDGSPARVIIKKRRGRE